MTDYTSAAYSALTGSARKCLHCIDRAIGDGTSAAVRFIELPIGSGSAGFSTKQLTVCGFLTTSLGGRGGNVWARSEAWQTLTADEAQLRIKTARLAVAPRNSKPVVRPVPKKLVKESKAGLDPIPRRQPSLPKLKCLEVPALE